MNPRLLFALGAAAGAYAGFARPWLLRWGATDDEILAEWPGDAYCPSRENQATRAVTIEAPVEAVWPWIVQIGQDRAGFYSYTELENLLALDMPEVHEIRPEWQQRQVGDSVWMAPQDRFDGKACMMVAWLEPNRAMTLIMPDDAEDVAAGGEAKQGIWSFILDPIDARGCRLIMRSRPGREPFLGEWAQRLFWEPAHFIMERRMMLRIKELAEGAAASGPRSERAPAAAPSH